MKATRTCSYPIFAGQYDHALKIINLKTNRVPAPCHLAAWHIDKVDRTDFFGWTRDGVPYMTGRDRIPQLTVVHLISRQMNLESLRTADEFTATRASEQKRMSPYLEMPDAAEWQVIDSQARAWVGDTVGGWRQVERIIGHLRDNFEHDRLATAPENCENVVAHFLGSGRGPDYMFATTAAVMLRSLGYPTRVVSGFYADPRKYDRSARQTIVEDEDVHFWVEVCVDGRTWIPVEPTPGYEPPLTVLTWKQRVARAVAGLGRWVRGHVLLSAGLLCAAFGLVVYRRDVYDAASYFLWRVASIGPLRRRVLWTVGLLESRGWIAGRRRPANRTLRQWYAPVVGGADAKVAASLLWLIDLADWARYSPERGHSIQWPCGDTEIRQHCRQVAGSWTSRRIRNQSRKARSNSGAGPAAVG